MFKMFLYKFSCHTLMNGLLSSFLMRYIIYYVTENI